MQSKNDIGATLRNRGAEPHLKLSMLNIYNISAIIQIEQFKQLCKWKNE